MLLRQVRSKRAFTLIELLVTVMILAILMAVAMPLYIGAIKDSTRKTCRANMQTIATAVVAAKVKLKASDYSSFMNADVYNEPDIMDNLGSGIICPEESTNDYSIQNGTGLPANSTFKIGCTETAHGTFEPGVDGI
ncbi:MAG: prepilin-type N-terminal cleavage/methylation domain-containing protein [Armatimonadetes bacterium]|nr:prepilin-type N-terminal cleavage/methylation domain-containing protein [Armatimonadota bacterium]